MSVPPAALGGNRVFPSYTHYTATDQRLISIVHERIRRLPVSKMPGGQKPEQYRAGDGSDCNHIDQVSRGHR